MSAFFAYLDGEITSNECVQEIMSIGPYTRAEAEEIFALWLQRV